MNLSLSQSISSDLRKISAYQGRKRVTKTIEVIACAGVKYVSKQYEIHHIATDKHKSKYTDQFKDIFSEGGLDLNYWSNKVALQGHKGRHKHDYHEAVLEHLKKMVTGGQAEAVVLGLVGDAAKDLIAEKITEGLLDIAESLCKKKGKWYKAFL
jgi:hypothetical protein